MASEKLDKQWDAWMESLSQTYVETLDLLDKDKGEEAHKLFKEKFLSTVKDMYAEVAETYPIRFSKTDNWCVWTKQLYTLTRMTERALEKKEKENAVKMLVFLREHFNVLHEKADFQRSNDFIYALHLRINAENPVFADIPRIREKLGGATAQFVRQCSCGKNHETDPDCKKVVVDPKAPMPEQVKVYRSLVEKAEPSAKAKANAEVYEKAQKGWLASVDKILEDNEINQDEMDSLRKETEKFFNEFGIQFE